MQHWWRESLAAASHVTDTPSLWLPGALAWTASVGWIALVIGVAPAPSLAELTFRGASIFNSGAWPWNAVALGVAALVLLLIGTALASAAEAALLHGDGARPHEVARLFGLAAICAVPVLIGLVMLAIGLLAVAPREFNAPDQGLDPLARTALSLAPLLAGVAVAASAGAALHAAAARNPDRGVVAALLEGPEALVGAGIATLLQAGSMILTRLAYLAVSATLLRVLWAPIGVQLETAGMDLVVALLLVGFVAIWLCLVLGGGALHAWGSLAWTGVLRRGQERMEATTGA